MRDSHDGEATPNEPRADAKQLRANLDALRTNETNWPDLVMAVAITLYDARLTHVSNEAFGEWLDANGFDDISHQDRAAFIGFAKHPTIARRVLVKTDRRSIQHIWSKEVQPQILEAVSPEHAATMAKFVEFSRFIVQLDVDRFAQALEPDFQLELKEHIIDIWQGIEQLGNQI